MAVVDLRLGDCRTVMAAMPAESVDAIVCDPPYGLSFMGKGWDHGVPGVEFWEAALRVLKPGGHLLAFGGTRTFHRLACAVEDAGFEIRDTIMYIYGSGFPKSLDVSKAIDKAAGATRETGTPGPYSARRPREDVDATNAYSDGVGDYGSSLITAPATPDARRWQGWGTALKPAFEPIVVARKPLVGTVAANVLAHGTGALNIDGCRVAATDKAKFPTGIVSDTEAVYGGGSGRYADRPRTEDSNAAGRWPANLIHDGSDEVLAGFPQSKDGVAVKRNKRGQPFIPSAVGFIGKYADNAEDMGYGKSGSAARFFYCAKASKRDRDEGLEGFEVVKSGAMVGNLVDGQRLGGNGLSISTPIRANHHPTVKPTTLMQYLVRLVTPPGEIVLDPFMGSGSTGKAAVLEGFNFIGIELDVEYIEIARARIAHALQSDKQQTLAL